jgi:hypothetical protein
LAIANLELQRPIEDFHVQAKECPCPAKPSFIKR